MAVFGLKMKKGEIMEYSEGKQKKCNKHGHYWVGTCCDGKIADDICPGCLRDAAPDLLAALKEGRKRLAFLHQAIRDKAKPIFDDIEIRKTGSCIIFIDESIAKTDKS